MFLGELSRLLTWLSIALWQSGPPTPPKLPERFFTNFTMFYTSRDDEGMPPPPWPSGSPPKVSETILCGRIVSHQLPYVAGRGATWYAADLGIALEDYIDFCVPVFDPPPYFPCTIFNYGHTAYLMAPEAAGLGPCCVYRYNWSIPHRDFMAQFQTDYSQTTLGFGGGVLSQLIDWWVIAADPDPHFPDPHHHQVFGGYGWTREALPSGYRVPVDFWYEGTVGWTQQLFHNFVDTGPRVRDLDHFTLPKECHTNITCLYQP